jgi:hypothetical protein
MSVKTSENKETMPIKFPLFFGLVFQLGLLYWTIVSLLSQAPCGLHPENVS